MIEDESPILSNPKEIETMLNRINLLRAGLVLAACVSLPHMAAAQGSNLFSGSGTTRGGTGGISGSLTGSGFGGTGFGSSGSVGGRSTTGFGSGGLGTGMSGTGGFGQSNAFGGTGMNGATGFGNTGFGATGATQGMVGRNSGAFAGNSQANQTGANGRGNTGATRNFNNTGSNRQNFNNNNNNQSTRNERNTSNIRPLQKVAFDYDAKSPTVAAANLTTRLARIGKRNPALNGVILKVDGEQVVLTGRVKNEDQHRLAINVLRQEPGIRGIRDELELEPGPTPE